METEYADEVDHIFDNLEKCLKCAICLDVYEEPIILPCGHTFCCKCIGDFDTYRKDNVPIYGKKEELKIGCPVCREEISSESIVKKTNGVRPNYALQHLLKYIAEQKQQENGIPKPRHVDAAINTDTLAYTEDRLNAMSEELDSVYNLTNTRRGELLGGCQDEINSIRRNNEKFISFQLENILPRNNYMPSFSASSIDRLTTSVKGFRNELSMYNSPMMHHSLGRVSQVDPGSFDPAIVSVGGQMSQSVQTAPQQLQTDAVRDMFSRFGR